MIKGVGHYAWYKPDNMLWISYNNIYLEIWYTYMIGVCVCGGGGVGWGGVGGGWGGGSWNESQYCLNINQVWIVSELSWMIFHFFSLWRGKIPRGGRFAPVCGIKIEKGVLLLRYHILYQENLCISRIWRAFGHRSISKSFIDWLLTHRGPVTQYCGGSISCKNPIFFTMKEVPQI